MLPSRAATLLDALPGRGAALLARAPGRVNLIGEHTDYNGLPVLPIAIDRDVLVAARRRDDDHVDLSNTGAAFPPRQYAVAAAIPPSPAGDWANYAKAAAEALVADLGRRGLGALPGGAFRVDGRVPLAAGLSSSSALLVACGLAHLSLAGVALPPAELAELFARAERYVGTLSGGMDQATALLARADHALRIDFFPLRARPVTIPASAVFVVAQSLERAEKSGAARGHYNQRVTECGLACAVLAQRLGVAAARLGDLPGPERVLDDLDRLLPEDARREMLPALTGLAPRARPALLRSRNRAGRPRPLRAPPPRPPRPRGGGPGRGGRGGARCRRPRDVRRPHGRVPPELRHGLRRQHAGARSAGRRGAWWGCARRSPHGRRLWRRDRRARRAGTRRPPRPDARSRVLRCAQRPPGGAAGRATGHRRVRRARGSLGKLCAIRPTW